MSRAPFPSPGDAAIYAGQPVNVVAVNGAWPEALVARADGSQIWVSLSALERP